MMSMLSTFPYFPLAMSRSKLDKAFASSPTASGVVTGQLLPRRASCPHKKEVVNVPRATIEAKRTVPSCRLDQVNARAKFSRSGGGRVLKYGAPFQYFFKFAACR